MYHLRLDVDGTTIGALDANGARGPLAVRVVPAALSPAHFRVFGPGVDEPSVVGVPNVFFIQTRDRFENDRVDDGQC